MIRKISNWLKITNNFPDYLLLLIALVAWWGAVVYYLYALNWPGIILSLILSVISFVGLCQLPLGQLMPTNDKLTEQNVKNNWLLLTVYILLYLGSIIILWRGRSDRALVSPWQVVNLNFFWFYALASLTLILIIINQKIQSKIKIIFISTHYLLALSVAVIIYKIGYGFDPFIHQATMELIAAKGLVLPKPPYYLGEYGLIVIFYKISGLSIYFLNKLLVPGLTALCLPLALYRFLAINSQEDNNNETTDKNQEKDNNTILLTVLLFLGLTFAPFIVTTPQNLSYLFLILTVLAVFGRFSLPGIITLALATTAIHPLTGLPAIALTVWLIFKKYQTRIKPVRQKIISLVIWVFTALSLPLALLLSGGSQGNKIGWSGSMLLKPLANIIALPNPAGQENWILNFIYLLAYNYNLLLVIIIIAAVITFYRKHDGYKKNQDFYRGLIFLNSALLIAYLLSNQIIFGGLINYEQTDYANRLTIIVVILFLPFILTGAKRLIGKIINQNRLIRTVWLIFALGLLSANLYLSYPRLDKYWNSRGYSTSRDDVTAVNLVDQNSNEPYIVLADQQVSAAALQEFGFNHYYQTKMGPLFFYPIPTSGPLYQYYLKLAYGNPDKTSLIGALNLTGVNRAYLIINKYWYQSDRLINQAKLTSDKWWGVNGQVYIFQYSR